MKLWKKTVLAPLAFAAVAASVQAVADDTITHTIKLKTTIPALEFHVEPVAHGWIGETQIMEYSSVKGEITPFSKAFKYKHTAGSITGSLGEAAVMNTDSGETIDLTVKFNDVELGLEAKEVVASAKAIAGGQSNLVISANTPTDGYVPGIYTGNVEVLFDPVLDEEEE